MPVEFGGDASQMPVDFGDTSQMPVDLGDFEAMMREFMKEMKLPSEYQMP